MKLNTKKLLSEVKRLEKMLDDNFDATGETLAEKIASSTKEMPKGIVEKMNFLANVFERASSGEKIDRADLKQAGYWVDAVYPYLSNGVERRGRGGSWILWAILVAVALYFCWHFLG